MWQTIPPGWTLVLLCLRLGNVQETLLWWLITGLYWHSWIFNTLLNILGNWKNVPQREVVYYIWIYYCQICNKDSFCKSEEILETIPGPPLSSVFVRSFNPVLVVVVVWGLREEGGWGRGLNTFFDVFQRWKNLLWQPKLYCKFFCVSYSPSLSALWLLNYSLC